MPRACRCSRHGWPTAISSSVARRRRVSGARVTRSTVAVLETAIGTESSEMVRIAMAFALQKLGRNYIPRLVESVDSDKLAPQIAAYLIELGPAVADSLVPHLKDPDPTIRGNVALMLGAIGTDTHVPAVQRLSRTATATSSAPRPAAIERIKMKVPSVRP